MPWHMINSRDLLLPKAGKLAVDGLARHAPFLAEGREFKFQQVGQKHPVLALHDFAHLRDEAGEFFAPGQELLVHAAKIAVAQMGDHAHEVAGHVQLVLEQLQGVGVLRLAEQARHVTRAAFEHARHLAELAGHLHRELRGRHNISYAADELYVWPSNWNRACLLTTDDNVHFSGAATLTGNWKLTAQKDFKGLQFGTSRTADEGTLVAGNTSLPITVETKGLVWMDVDLAALTYKIQTAETLGLVGNMTGWGETPDIEMTPNADFNIWTATVTFPENGDFKIRANSSWDGLNFGGDMDDLNYGGANLTCEPGTYDVTLTIGYDHVYTLKMVKK